MKKIFLLLVIIGCFLLSKAQKTVMVAIQPPHVCSYDAKEKYNSYVGFVASDVKSEGNIVIKKGTPVKFRVETRRRKGAGKPGKITMMPELTSDVNGNIISLVGEPIKLSGENNIGRAYGLGLGLGLTVLFPWGLFFFCIKGEDCCYDGAIVACTAVIDDNQYFAQDTLADKTNKTFSLDSTNLMQTETNTSFEVENSTSFTSTKDITEKDKKPFIKRGMFNMYIDWNLFLGKTNHYDEFNISQAGFTWGGGMYFTFGARIFDYVFVGAGFGSEILPSIYTSYYGFWGYDYVGGFFNIPSFVNVRGFIPVTNRIYPYVDIAVGPSFLFYLENFDSFDFCPVATTLRFGVGVDFSRFSLGLGYEGVFGYNEYYVMNAYRLAPYMKERVKINTAYLKLGIRIGSME